ncbi:hypothetical protein TNCV_382301 [Trichonephila clavipes]|nr:hypothetical protein TNCV_382301 [Trichonephila clavipes]
MYPDSACADSRFQNLCRFQMSSDHLCRFPRCPRTCADSRCSSDSSVTRVPQPPMQILPEPMNIHSVSVQIPDSRGSRTCADSSVTRPTATCADSTATCRFPEPMQHSTCNLCRFQNLWCADSSVTRPTATYADSLPEPMNSLCRHEVPEPVQIPVSHVPQPPMQVLHVSEPVQIPVSSHSHQNAVQIPDSSVTRPTATYAGSMYQNLCRFQSHVPQPPVQSLPEPVQIPVSHVPHLCRVSQNLCSFSQSSTCWTLWSRQMHSTSSCRLYLDPKNSSCFTRYPLFLMRISSLSWMKGSLWT